MKKYVLLAARILTVFAVAFSLTTCGDFLKPGLGDEVDLEDPTYADCAKAVGYSPHEVSVLVDGRPVPEDQPVEVDRVTVLRLVKGG